MHPYDFDSEVDKSDEKTDTLDHTNQKILQLAISWMSTLFFFPVTVPLALAKIPLLFLSWSLWLTWTLFVIGTLIIAHQCARIAILRNFCLLPARMSKENRIVRVAIELLGMESLADEQEREARTENA